MIMTCPCCGRAHKPPSCVTCTPQKSIESDRAACARWRKKNRAHIRAREKERRVSRPSGKREAGIREWQKANPERMKAYRQAYRASHLEEVRRRGREFEARKRARMALEELESAKKSLKPDSEKVARALYLADENAKKEAELARYGIKRLGIQGAR